ncbi:MAG: cation:proton antiporter, partial [Planctomycetes bacterium]|nr:cation:proton antiporter [Planctomycetota bacterium]
SVTRVKSLGRRSLGGGVLQVVITLVVAGAAAMAFGQSLAAATAIGAMVALSSTAVVLRILMERAQVESPHGRNSVAVLLVQDMAVVPLAVLMGLLVGGGTFGEVAANVSRIVLLATGLVVALYLLLNKLAVKVLGTLTLERNRELTIIMSVATGLGSTIAAHAIGISPALGAFIAGMFLGASPFATQIRADISSLRVVLLTLFFGAAGMVADPIWILQHLPLVLGLLILLTVGKTVIIWGIYRALGVSTPIALATGICLAQIGEFAFVLAKPAVDNGVIDTETHLLMVSVAIASLFVSPFLVPKAGRIAGWLTRRASQGSDLGEHTESADIVIVGFGPAGQVAARSFVNLPTRVLVIDLNHDGVRRARQLGFRGEIGDATQFDVLEHAHLAAVKAVIITIPHFESALTILQHTRRLAPQAHCVVRSRYARHSHDFRTAGAHAVFGDEEQIGSALGVHLEAWLANPLPHS